MRKKIIIGSIIFLLIDIISKILIDNFLELNESFIIVKSFFNFTKVYNYGASWSILTGYQILLIILAIVVLIVLSYYQKRFKNNKRNILAFACLYAGIIGNLINRILFGYVIDFLDFNIFGYNYPVFNIADVLIVLGTLLLIIAIFKK